MNNQELIQCAKRQKALSNQRAVIENKKAASELLQKQVDEWIANGGKIADLDTHERFQEATFSGNNQQQTKRVKLSGAARREAQRKGEIFYHGLGCSVCKETLRYVRNMNCVACDRKRAAQRGRSKVQRVVGEMA